jgi:hypothetical protein
MPFRMRAALAAVLLMAVVTGCGGGAAGIFGAQYEYEEDLTLSLDGSATMIVNASIPALVVLRGLPLSTDPSVRVDRDRIRELYTSPYSEVTRVSTWTRAKRRFVGIRINVSDIRQLPQAAPFSWSRYNLRQADGLTLFKQTLGASAFKAGTMPNVGWRGDELVAFRLHLPSRIEYQNSRTLDTDQPRGASRGNILTWEQHLADRIEGKPIAWEDGVPGVMAVRMDSQSILYRTLWLFGLAFLAAVAVLALLIWLTMRRGREADRAAA